MEEQPDRHVLGRSGHVAGDRRARDGAAVTLWQRGRVVAVQDVNLRRWRTTVAFGWRDDGGSNDGC